MVREDLPPGARVAQAVHAAVDHSLRYPDEVMSAPTVVVLGIVGERQLADLADRLSGVTRFTEPDLGDQLTAIALIAEPKPRELRRLSLLLREEVKR